MTEEEQNRLDCVKEEDLRDHFAGLAMQMYMSGETSWAYSNRASIAAWAYDIAEAMVDERAHRDFSS